MLKKTKERSEKARKDSTIIENDSILEGMDIIRNDAWEKEKKVL